MNLANGIRIAFSHVGSHIIEAPHLKLSINNHHLPSDLASSSVITTSPTLATSTTPYYTTKNTTPSLLPIAVPVPPASIPCTPRHKISHLPAVFELPPASSPLPAFHSSPPCPSANSLSALLALESPPTPMAYTNFSLPSAVNPAASTSTPRTTITPTLAPSTSATLSPSKML